MSNWLTAHDYSAIIHIAIYLRWVNPHPILRWKPSQCFVFEWASVCACMLEHSHNIIITMVRGRATKSPVLGNQGQQMSGIINKLCAYMEVLYVFFFFFFCYRTSNKNWFTRVNICYVMQRENTRHTYTTWKSLILNYLQTTAANTKGTAAFAHIPLEMSGTAAFNRDASQPPQKRLTLWQFSSYPHTHSDTWHTHAEHTHLYVCTKLTYSGKLSREKTFTNFEVLEPPAKVFSTKSGRATPTYVRF